MFVNGSFPRVLAAAAGTGHPACATRPLMPCALIWPSSCPADKDALEPILRAAACAPRPRSMYWLGPVHRDLYGRNPGGEGGLEAHASDRDRQADRDILRDTLELQGFPDGNAQHHERCIPAILA